MQLKTKDEMEAATSGGNFQSRDDLYNAAVDIVIRERRGSCSLLQRALGIGYGRAARLIDFMAEDGVVGQYNGSQARDVLISLEEWESRQQDDGGGVQSASGVAARPATPITAANVVPQRRNRVAPEPSSDMEDEESDVDEELEDASDDDEELEDDQEWDDEDSDAEAAKEDCEEEEFDEEDDSTDVDESENDESEDEWDEEDSEEDEEEWVEKKVRSK
jgi:S-DNA-T family DNA segregation ATPase FtsK/SpoIIIE